MTKEVRRGLVLVTKVLQHLANGVTNFRETYMTGLDWFVSDNMKLMETICDEFAVCNIHTNKKVYNELTGIQTIENTSRITTRKISAYQ